MTIITGGILATTVRGSASLQAAAVVWIASHPGKATGETDIHIVILLVSDHSIGGCVKASKTALGEW